MATIIHKTNSRCVPYIKAGAANMAGAWFIHRTAGLYGPLSQHLSRINSSHGQLVTP